LTIRDARPARSFPPKKRHTKFTTKFEFRLAFSVDRSSAIRTRPNDDERLTADTATRSVERTGLQAHAAPHQVAGSALYAPADRDANRNPDANPDDDDGHDALVHHQRAQADERRQAPIRDAARDSGTRAR
jgi:hypothetical protein